MTTRRRSERHRLYGAHFTDSTARMVWAELSRDPRQTVRAIAKTMGVSHPQVQASVKFLIACGYVQAKPRGVRARRVILPYITGRLVRAASQKGER